MLTLPPSVKIYLARGVTDMRKSYDGLCHAVRGVLDADPFSGHIFGFSNRARNRVKLLVWDHGGFWLFCRRLEKGTFDWPGEDSSPRLEMTSRELLALLEGLDLSSAKWSKRYERPVCAAAP